jgi:hypothetical protein
MSSVEKKKFHKFERVITTNFKVAVAKFVAAWYYWLFCIESFRLYPVLLVTIYVKYKSLIAQLYLLKLASDDRCFDSTRSSSGHD